MICKNKDCGACNHNKLSFREYKNNKCKEKDNIYFAPLGSRRRVNFAFSKNKFGFYQQKTHNIIDINDCPNLSFDFQDIKKFVLNLGYLVGEVYITKADNGLAIKIETKSNITLDNKLDLADFINSNENIISIAINDYEIKKIDAHINIADYKVFINADSFLQATKETEQKMLELTSKYLLNTNGKILDLYCGLGTFSYPLAKNIKNKITSIEINPQALELFQKTINYNQIPNISIKKQNLLKYPLTSKELEDFDAIVFDPPYKGAHSQVKEICACNKMFNKIVAISCNEETFNKDKELLIKKGYTLKELTYIDQFLFSDHIELIALFEG